MLRKLTILLAAVLAAVALLAPGASAHRVDPDFPRVRLAHKGELIQESEPGSFTYYGDTAIYDQYFQWPRRKMVETGRYTIIIEHPLKPTRAELLAYRKVEPYSHGGNGTAGYMKLHRKLVPIYRDGEIDAWAAKFNINRPHRPYYLVFSPMLPGNKDIKGGWAERDFHVETR